MTNEELWVMLWAAGMVEIGSCQWQVHEELTGLPDAPVKFNFRPDETETADQAKRRKETTRVAGWWIAWEFFGRSGLDIPRYIAGVPTVGSPLAKAARTNWPGKIADIPRLLPLIKNEDQKIALEPAYGYPTSGRVTLIDDVLSSGKRKLEAKAVLESIGLQVTSVAVLVEHDIGGRALLQKHDLPVFSVATAREVLGHLRQTGGLIDPDDVSAYDWFCQTVRERQANAAARA